MLMSSIQVVLAKKVKEFLTTLKSLALEAVKVFLPAVLHPTT